MDKDMNTSDGQIGNLLLLLTGLCRNLIKGEYGDAEALFDLTRKEAYPPQITELAEAFGLMLVKVEARDFHLNNLIEQLQQAQEELEQAHDALARENIGLKRSLNIQFSPSRIIGQNRRMRDMLDQTEKIADTPVSVLITGETGTGKELIAKSLHYNSSRHQGPFIALNCSAIPETLLESELFGIEKGVASGVSQRMGRLEQASGGTLFLDEIGDMPLASQAKLLRVLEERKIVRIGGREPISVDIRLVSATHKDLQAEITHNRFRQDLFFRIKVVNLHIPPLRERLDDIPLLLNSFLDIHSKKMGKEPVRISPEAIHCLTRFNWPGNVRELENEVERGVALASEGLIDTDDLSDHIRLHVASISDTTGENGPKGRLYEVEKNLIIQVLSETNDNQTQTAKQLGISREGLRKKMKRYGISRLSN